MKRNWELIDFVVKTIAESDKDIFGINDFKSAETSEKEIKYTLKLMLDRGLAHLRRLTRPRRCYQKKSVVTQSP